MEFLGLALYDEDFIVMLLRFGINLVFISIIIRLLYYRYTKKTNYVFAFYLVSIVVFFLCFTLKDITLDIGIALGLFAIFGIIRYRTRTIRIKEMTYLFVVIGISVINALANTQMTYAEIVLANVAVIGSIYIIETAVLSRQRLKRNITYGNLDYIKPENHQKLMEDLIAKTGLNIKEVTVGSVDYANEQANLTIHYIR